MKQFLAYIARPLGARAPPFAWERMLMWALIVVCIAGGDDLVTGAALAREVAEGVELAVAP